ncbi:MAG: hypothetical protein IJ172_11310 [Ruminococcus sp.]|nr:hypothetical protein [Ruminococcus sp.]
MDNKKREFDPIRAQTPSVKNIMCRDCKYRDKTFIELNERKIYVGITRDTCEKYKGRTQGGLKPHEVLFQNDLCKYYEKE